MRFFSSMDELQRRIQLEAFAFSFGATGIVTFSYRLLTYVGFPELNWVWIFPLMIALWGIGQGMPPADTEEQTERAMQNKLKVLRAERDWSQAELADAWESRARQ